MPEPVDPADSIFIVSEEGELVENTGDSEGPAGAPDQIPGTEG